jgi:hypothetical protein
MFSHIDEVEMTRKYRKEHDLMGYEAEDLIDDFDQIYEQDISQFKYPEDIEIEKIGVRGIYLNNYIRWDSKAQHEAMIKLYNYETNYQTRTFDHYNDVDCYNYSDIHDYIKFLKHGYGKIIDHVTREIRLKRLKRNDAINIVKKYIYKKPENLDLFLNWIGMTENGFNYIIDQHRNKKIWHRNDNWEWELIQTLIFNNSKIHSIDESLQLNDNEEFKNLDWLLTTPELEHGNESSYYFYWIQTAYRDQLAKYLRSNDIYSTFRYYPLHLVPYYNCNKDFPMATKVSNETLCIPLHQSLSESEIQKVIESIKSFNP